jgi:hypothetical protein
MRENQLRRFLPQPPEPQPTTFAEWSDAVSIVHPAIDCNWKQGWIG